MDDGAWVGLLLGITVGIAHATAAYFIYRHALRYDGVDFTKWALGGMVVRMVVFIGIILCILLIADVNEAVFALTLMICVAIAVGVEVYLFLPKAGQA